MAPRTLLCCLALLALAGCGGEEEPDDGSVPGGPAPTTQLTVRVDADGDGPGRPKQARISCDADGNGDGCQAAAGLRPADFEPVGDGIGCTAMIDGPQTARVYGTLERKPIEATFARNNGCEIERWDTVAALLELPG